ETPGGNTSLAHNLVRAGDPCILWLTTCAFSNFDREDFCRNKRLIMPPEKRRKKRKPNSWVVPVAVGGALLLLGIGVTVVLLTMPGDDDVGSAGDGIKGRTGADGGKLLAPADDLNAIIAELDTKDPNWKLEQWLKQPLPEKNGAAQAMAAARHLPQKWPPQP